MASQPAPVNTPVKPAPNETKIGLIIRVAFFIGIVIIGQVLLVGFLYGIFGTIVATTIGLCATGLAANLLTMRIFDRRPLVDIGLQGGRPSLINFLLGLVLGGGSAALMLFAPLLAGTGHLVFRAASDFTWPSLITYLFALLIAATGEELIFRGYAFQLLVEKIGPFATVLPVGVIFGVAHAWNPNASGLGVM